eukprot:3837473-Pleurochrysis_carterae.AAC.2
MRSLNADGLQESVDDIAEIFQALRFAAAFARACRWRCEVRSPSAGCGAMRLLERRHAASTRFRTAERGILCAPCPNSP